MNPTQIVGGNVVLENGIVTDGIVAFADGRIVYAGPSEVVARRLPYDFEKYDATGRWVFPGFIDLHIHGGGGKDTMDASAEALAHIAYTHGIHGTTGFLATTMTAPHDEIINAARAVRRAVDKANNSTWNGARLLGLHLEGPYLNPMRAGAQDPTLMKEADLGELQDLLDLLGPYFRLATVAPEMPGGMAAVQWLASRGVIVSAGHSDASFDEATASFRAGVRHVTHMFNGMRGLHHRDPGIAGAALLESGVMCEIIADGVHLHPEVVRLLYRVKGVDGLCLITDGIEAVDMPPGTYKLGGKDVTVADGICRLADGALAGSMLTMDRAVGYVVNEVGVSVVDAARMAALNPARQLRIADKTGSFRPGKNADIVVLDDEFRAVDTWVEGRRIKRVK